MQTIKIKTQEKQRMQDVTKQVQAYVKECGVIRGTCTVFCPHTTAAVTLQENSDPDVKEDMLAALERMVSGKFKHAEGNSAAHIKSSMIGSSVTMFVENRKLVLGSWQAVFFCEFDGPRDRNLLVRVSPDPGSS
jgi:secondary thiamine-phosphate synthase enzyme